MAGNGAYQKMDDEMEFTSAGLTTAQAEAQQKKWGKNEIPEEKEPVSAAISMFGPSQSPRCMGCTLPPAPSRCVRVGFR